MFDSWKTAVQLVLIIGWFLGSTLVWARLLERRTSDFPAWEPPGSSSARIPAGVMLGTALWLAFQFVMKLTAAPEVPVKPSLLGVQLMCGINLVIAALWPLAMIDGRRSPADFGFSLADCRKQIDFGIQAFFAAVWPTALMLLISMAWRTQETQHSHLQALRDPENSTLVAWIVFSAVVAAPLAEELLFRVTLQSWLAERMPAALAIVGTAMMFALVHGWRDALPLLPLSLILGYLYHRTRSYWACVTAHAIFNASNLAMVLLADDRLPA